jgi:uncharacterized RDD family membrane protein YckC
LQDRKPRLYHPQETDRMRELAGVELASFTSRAVAFCIDFVIAGALFLGGLLLFFKLANRYTSLGANNRHLNVELNFFENWYSVVYLVLFFGLSVYVGNGRTIGKRIMGIRVVSIVHHRMGLWHSIERALGYGASALEFGFGFVQYFIHPNRRTVHDRMAETIVIRDKRR